jgi:GT2 family glycosyltransferase
MLASRHEAMRLVSAAIRVLFADGPVEVLRRAKVILKRAPTRRAYQRWAQLQDELLESQRDELRAQQSRLALRPRISILMPVFNTREQWLREALDSVLAQLYENWELCIADDCSSKPHVRLVLSEYASRDARIKVIYRESNGHIAAATNSALDAASGEFVSLMDHDDVIPENALCELVKKLNEIPSADMIYSDEDKIDTGGRRHDPAFKPDWSPDYLESCMYTAHLAIYRKTIVDEIGGFRPGYDGAQDYDFVLRFTERASCVAHVPKVLYHWRAIPGSTATSMFDKNYVVPAGIRALQDRLARNGQRGTVAASRFPGCFDVRVKLAEQPLVSVVIPTAGRDRKIRRKTQNLVLHCVEQVQRLSTYPNYEIVIVDNGDLSDGTRQALLLYKCRLITYGEPEFNISKKLNLGASIANGSYLLLLNDDIEVIRGDWIEAMLEQGVKPGVGAVGAKLLYENRTLQHVGVVHANGLPDHVRKNYSTHDPGYLFSTVSVRNYLAVTGACMLTPSALFRQVGGFHEEYKVNYSDIDYCLKLRELGYRSVYTPHAELFHFESASRPAEVAEEEIALYRRRWRTVTMRDPYYNADYFRAAPPDFALQFKS